jgi:hypothetical protein
MKHEEKEKMKRRENEKGESKRKEKDKESQRLLKTRPPNNDLALLKERRGHHRSGVRTSNTSRTKKAKSSRFKTSTKSVGRHRYRYVVQFDFFSWVATWMCLLGGAVGWKQ